MSNFHLPSSPSSTFTNSAAVMGSFRNGIFTKAIVWLLALLVIAINFYLVVQTVIGFKLTTVSYGPYVLTAMILAAIPYLSLVLYLGYKAFVTTLPVSWGERIEKQIPRLAICQWPCLDKSGRESCGKVGPDKGEDYLYGSKRLETSVSWLL